jgi:hypothetical protein
MVPYPGLHEQFNLDIEGHAEDDTQEDIARKEMEKGLLQVFDMLDNVFTCEPRQPGPGPSYLHSEQFTSDCGVLSKPELSGVVDRVGSSSGGYSR